ncbi:FAD-binding oxidoreductase [Acuticoccus mangrovi]|uniref:FAD-binding oxidoreductase n=1 Tax=Acuticoccus mangrovi TaxID=2796142 RepID=A0A934IQL8_9HYPH|nr:FAD-binding oxidoreductase [Acuticoccus mangrovi]MBJ3778292.1 FAD-binding oxidoreductase [Acuticoccus mangrovi]
MSSPLSSPRQPADTAAIAQLRDAVVADIGEAAILNNAADMAPYLKEWRDLYTGVTPFVLRPRSTEETATMVRHAARLGVAVVPQSGNTGLVGGQIPVEAGNEVLISTDRMNAIEEVDARGSTMTVQAGVILQEVQRAAEEAGRLFPLSLASEGSARIGGLISTNAGGTGVLAYGNMRDQVLGLEVVMPDGRIWNGLRALHKDNTGYDLKHLFIGAEGTLGIITRAVLKLAPLPHARDAAVVGVASPADALTLLGRISGRLGDALTAFELVPRFGLELVLKYGADTRNPFTEGMPDWMVLIEASTFAPDRPMRDILEAELMAAYEAGEISDAMISQSLAEAQDFWRLRELLSEVQSHEGGSIKHDVSVPIADVPAFLAEATEAVLKVVPGARPVAFGHLGDGNIHFNITQPEGADKAAYLARWDEMNAAVHAVVRRYKGSIAAEHGVGRLKRDLVPTVRDAVELDLMQRIKAAFDPDDLMNPGRLLPMPGK